MDPLDPMDMPLEPAPEYLVTDVIEPIFFSEDGFQESVASGDPREGIPFVLKVLVVGKDVKLFEPGDYIISHPNNCELRYIWRTRKTLLVFKQDVVCAKVNKQAVEEMLARMEKFNKKVQPPGPGLVQGPPPRKIIHPGGILPGDALTPEL